MKNGIYKKYIGFILAQGLRRLASSPQESELFPSHTQLIYKNGHKLSRIQFSHHNMDIFFNKKIRASRHIDLLALIFLLIYFLVNVSEITTPRFAISPI